MPTTLRGAHGKTSSLIGGGVAYAAGFLGGGVNVGSQVFAGRECIPEGLFVYVALNSRGMRLIRDGRFALELLV